MVSELLNAGLYRAVCRGIVNFLLSVCVADSMCQV